MWPTCSFTSSGWAIRSAPAPRSGAAGRAPSPPRRTHTAADRPGSPCRSCPAASSGRPCRKPKWKKKSGNPRKQAHRHDALLLGLLQQRAQNPPARALPLGLRLHHNRPHLGQVRPIQMQRAAAQKDAALRLGHREVAHVLADLRVAAAQQRSVAGERVDQLEDVDRVLQPRLAHHRAARAGARGCGGFAGGHQGRAGQVDELLSHLLKIAPLRPNSTARAPPPAPHAPARAPSRRSHRGNPASPPA